MRKLRLLPLALALPLFYGVGCDTHAVGVEECRQIEKARCAAAQYCNVGIDKSGDSAVCERFARDNCLHGLPLEATPPAGKIDACVRAIDAAGACAKDHGSDYEATSCAIKGGVTTVAATVCEIVQDPEEAVDCGFLLPEPKPAVTPPPEDAGADAAP